MQNNSTYDSTQIMFSKLESSYGLPKGLLDAVWFAESGRGKQMLSKVGAKGHFQFMDDTAKEFGLNDPYDLKSAATTAAKYYARLSKIFDGDIHKMLAGYNWGQGNVQRKGMSHLPEETKKYISKITNEMQNKCKRIKL
jgi:soluble lytic murein transglycosylase-like protein